ncbi:glycoside hydrolase family 31 protein [Cylindrobasidium torrendii FP15055 ss-10]|uniref:alpha-D-xyloside xylohydrolase n=1 Tax=Cylindrobasidium torrendii FP15055 ss-10 TaxID=1314674 RepID=A0A0D7BFI3_9AGAR|nr:glycoside hydrolase family 31 protein [Cylindrobasidium torrendii FP15055 ss-10]
MVKFSKGMWWPAPNTTISWAVEAAKAEAFEDRVRYLASTKRLLHRGDTLNTPTISLDCSSPVPDVLLLKTTHWKAQASTNIGPEFELFPDVDIKQLAINRQDGLKCTKTESTLNLSTNTLSATFDTTPGSFGLDIVSHSTNNPMNKFNAPNFLLTKLGWRSVGYVKQNTSLDHPNLNLVDPEKGDRWTTMQFQLSVGEKIYGLGERFGNFIKNGQTVDMWNEDGGTSSELTYKNVPFFISSRGYGIFVDCPGHVSFEIQSERTTRVNISVPFERLPVYIIHGPSPKEIIQRYTALTGRPALPPPWTFNLWLSTSFTTDYDEGTVNQFLQGMEERDISVGVFHFDCFWMKGFHWCDFEFDKDYFPDARGQLARLKERGYKVCVWINPYIAQESAIFDEGVESGFFIKRKDGSVWQWDFWQAGMAFVDFTNPKAWEWYQSKLSALIDLGVDCFKTDFGERIPTGDVVYFDGSNPAKMHNYYAFLYNKATFEVLEKRLGKNEAAVFARSATAGAQRFPVHWGGDPMSTFEAMAESLRGGLSLGLCGFGYWAHDIGGFEGKPDAALYKRWFAFGALSSHSRLHGSGSFRVPWLLDETGEADKVLQKFINFKLALMPYLYGVAIDTHRTGVPMMRALFTEFPEEAEAWNVDTQYMLGPNVMVVPIFNAEGTTEYYVPKGRWYGLLDGKVREGPGYVRETHDFFSLPVLLRPGTAVALGRYAREGERKLAQYDYTDVESFVVNAAEDVDVDVELPDVEKLGEAKGIVRIKGGNGGLEVRTTKGPLKEWRMKVVVPSGEVNEVGLGNGSAKLKF